MTAQPDNAYERGLSYAYANVEALLVSMFRHPSMVKHRPALDVVSRVVSEMAGEVGK